MNNNYPTTTTPGGYPISSSVSSRGRYNATAVMLVDVPNMDDDDVLMTSSCSSSRGSGSREGRRGRETKRTKKTNSNNVVALAAARSIVPLDDRIKYIEFKDDVDVIEHDADEITTFASLSTSSSSSTSRHKNHRYNSINCRSEGEDGDIRSSRLNQINHRYDEAGNDLGTTRNNVQRQSQREQLEFHQHQKKTAGQEDDEEEDRPTSKMRIGDTIRSTVEKSTSRGNNQISINRSSTIFEIVWGQDGIYNEKGAANTVNNHTNSKNGDQGGGEEDDETESEYYCDGTIQRRGMKNDTALRREKRNKIHHRCQNILRSCCCSIRLPLNSYLKDDLGIVKPIAALSCMFVCFVVATTFGVVIALMVSHHHVHQNDMPTMENSGGGEVSGGSNNLSTIEIASMSNADRLILAKRIDHICDKLHSTSSNGGDGGGGADHGECWSLCHEKRCCFTKDATRRLLADSTIINDAHTISLARLQMLRRGNEYVYDQQRNHEYRRLQLAHMTIPGENDFTYVAHKVNGSKAKTTEVVTSEDEKEKNCAKDPNEFCLVYAGCAPLFGE